MASRVGRLLPTANPAPQRGANWSSPSCSATSSVDTCATLCGSPPTFTIAFGLQVVFFKAPPPGQSNLSPYSGLQFFGEVNIHAQSADMTVDLRDINGVSVFSRRLQPRMN